MLEAIEASGPMWWLAQIPAVQVLRQVWIQQYFYSQAQLHWRGARDLPPYPILIQSPYDLEARNRTKRQTNWTGYAVHLSETCNEQGTNLITHVVTTPATVADSTLLPEIHQALQRKDLTPDTHLVDMAYVQSQHLHQARILYLLPQEPFEALEKARARQKTPEFWTSYAARAGIEGTLSQAVRAFALRRSRYIGLAKTHLQQVAVATAINFVRLAASLQMHVKGQTRVSHFARLLAQEAPA